MPALAHPRVPRDPIFDLAPILSASIPDINLSHRRGDACGGECLDVPLQ